MTHMLFDHRLINLCHSLVFLCFSLLGEMNACNQGIHHVSGEV